MTLTKWLWLGLVAAVACALWLRLRPYEWRPDPDARFVIVAAQLTPDHANQWLELHLQHRGTTPHDWSKPTLLTMNGDRVMKPQDHRAAGGSALEPEELWLKFWLEPGDLDGPIQLRLNDGTLTVKANRSAPNLAPARPTVFTSTHW